MNRTIFGSWGSELPLEDFACAAAAYGINFGWVPKARPEEVAQWLKHSSDHRGKRNMTWEWHDYFLSRHFADSDAWAWAKGWRQFVEKNGRGRMELNVAPPEQWQDLVELFSVPAVNAEAIYVRQDQPQGEVRWNWPLRVGFLGDPASRSLYSALEILLAEGVSSWRREYLELCPPGDLHGLGCHILLMPSSVTQSLGGLCAVRRVVRAACALVLGPADSTASLGTLLSAIRAQARAEAVALVDLSTYYVEKYANAFGLPTRKRTAFDLMGIWFIEFARQLSHDQCIDQAIFELWRQMGNLQAPPLLISSRRLVQDSRIGARLKRLAHHFQGPEVRSRPISLGRETALRLGLAGARQTNFNELGAFLVSRLDDLAFYHETDAGTATLHLLNGLRELREQQRQQRGAKRPARWLQVNVFQRPPDRKDEAATEEVRRSSSFRRGITHIVEVFVGPREAGAIQPPSDAPPVPEQELPEDRGVTLTVVFVDSRKDHPPQMGKIFLPRDGRSTDCRFFLDVPENLSSVEVRILLVYRNRILQTSLLSGLVSGGSEEGSGIAIEPEAEVRGSLDGLEWRDDFDATLLLNHSAGGEAAVTAVQDDYAARFPLPGDTSKMERAIKWFDGEIESIIKDPKKYDRLSSPANVDFLRSLAQHGRSLFEEFDWLIPKGLDYSRLERLQVVSVDPNTRLPVEFFYDRKAPLPTARLCPDAAESLKTGVCGKKCPSCDDESVVCPLGFWGLRKIIERHMTRKGEAPGQNELRQAEPVERRNSLSIFGPNIFAASDVVDAVKKGGIVKVSRAISSLDNSQGGKAKPSEVRDWDEWSRRVATQASRLLFIMPHVKQSDLPTLQIGKKSELLVVNLDTKHVRIPADRDPPPVVVLLGCETAKAQFPFGEPVGKFRRLGAAIVLCTGASILGQHAVPVALSLIKALRAACSAKESQSLGDVMRVVRRQMVLQGVPMVFTITAFGDSDWKIQREAPADNGSTGGRSVSAVGDRPGREREVTLVTP